MALIVENGEGLEDAESIVSVAYYLDYCEKRGYGTAATTGKEEQYLRLANEFFYSKYSFKGKKFKETQSMPFPRIINNEYVFPNDVKKSICELVLKLPHGDLLSDGERLTTSEKVGDIEVHYSEYSKDETEYKRVVNLLMPWLSGSSFGSSIVRTY